MTKYHDITGQRFGYWTVVSYSGSTGSKGKATWLCRCDCGNEKVVTAESLKRGKSKSCGCKSNDMRAAVTTKHGHTATSQGRHSKTYASWHAMRQRCLNPNITQFSDYGGRGITICERWSDFRNFLEDMGERPEGQTLDRIDADGNYEPSNCRWATRGVQALNKRPRVKHSDVLGIVEAARTLVAANDNEIPDAIAEVRSALSAFDNRKVA